MADSNQPGGEIILYQTEDNQTRVQVRLDGQTAWLSLNQLAELFRNYSASWGARPSRSHPSASRRWNFVI